MKKILSLAITLMMVLSVASIPAMAAELPAGAYANVPATDAKGDSTNLSEHTESTLDCTLDEFKELFNKAQYTAFEDFENETSHDGDVLNANNISGKDGRIQLSPFYMELKGMEENAEFRLRFADPVNGAYLYMFNSTEEGKFSSGTSALYRQFNANLPENALEFAVGANDGKDNVVRIDRVAQPYKVKAFGVVLYQFVRKNVVFTVTYENGGTETIALRKDPENKETNRFWGFVAPDGQYISKVKMTPVQTTNTASYVIDDVALIFDKVVAIDRVAISGAETVAEPQYNATTTAQLTAAALDAEGNEVPAEIEWAVSGNGASIDQNGLLTLKRTNDVSIAGDIKVTATADGVAATKTITVTAADAYFAATTDFNATEYTKAAFVADLAAAQNKAVMNFEDGAHSFDDSDNANLKIYSEITGTDTLFNVQLAAWSSGGTKQTGRYSTTALPGTVELQTQNATGSSTAEGFYRFTLKELEGNLKPTAVGMLLGRNDEVTFNCISFRIYLNGASSAIEYRNISGVRGFFGYKAPEGRYIDYIELETGKKTYLDDLSFIFNETNAPAITLTQDEAGAKMIDRLADAEGDVYVNIAKAFSDKKVLLALYGAGDELLDVAVANENATQALAQVPAGKTLTGIKAFVWDIAKLIPAQAPVEINE